MGEVAAVYKIMLDMEKKEHIKDILKEIGAREIQEEPIGFGITALKVIFILEDSSGNTEELEKKINKIEGINSVQVEGVSLV
ncbi:MAG: elongation factor 1-beta [Candidatus Aenigmarchaeota archaeon ex4484_56]|nr:MAG: elongation factor 1-beta [Candidatus Aenigmarchaeota archaeon ex4484_56]